MEATPPSTPPLPWETEGDLPFLQEEEEEAWPESLAGPEYWLLKKLLDNGYFDP